MGHCIIKIKDCYLEWSSVVDAPVSRGVGRAEFEKYYRRVYGKRGAYDLSKRLDRADEFGVADNGWGTVDDVIEFNRAGKDGTCLTLDEIYTQYCQVDGKGGDA